MVAVPETDVVDRLDSAVAALNKSGASRNLFPGKVEPPGDYVPHQAVFVMASGGPAPLAYAGGSAVELDEPSVQVRVRSNPGDYAGGYALRTSVRNALHHQPLTADYIDIGLLQEPLYLGEDEAGHHEWSINLKLQFEE
jgi:hypothetical protein